MANRLSTLTVGCLLFCVPFSAEAAFAPITYRYKHHLFTIDPDNYPQWRATAEVWHLGSQPIRPPATMRVDGDVLPELPEGMQKMEAYQWIPGAIRATLLEEIGQFLHREPQSVVIRKHTDGTIVFDGAGLFGRKLQLDETVQLTLEAIENGITDIIVPVQEIPATVTVQDPELRSLGIQEVVAIGESDFRGSPANREHNIQVGLDRFNGHVIPQGAIFSFNEVLGPVNAATGYRQELVIKGDKTLPDYGGGLCQVSTTAYRGVWEYGFPIDQRINHSYSVQYYAPSGTDATIYPPYKDVKFTNNSPGALLVQTYNEDGRAYFIYYGTKDERTAEVVGPFMWGQTSVPADRVEYTTDIPPGTTRKVGERVPGVKSAWFRLVQMSAAQDVTVEPTYSSYEARPRYTQIGVETLVEPVEQPAAAPEQAVETPAKEETASPVRRWVERIRRRD